MSRRRARYTEADITRIFRAAAKAHVDVRVRIASDGSIVISTSMPGMPNEATANPWDEVLHDAAEQKRPS